MMNVMVRNYRGALSPNFCKIIPDMVKGSSPDILFITETRIRRDGAKKISDKLSFNGIIHTDTIDYTDGLWVL